MAEITGNSLIQDWYDRYVKPLKQPTSLTSSAPQDFSLGLPTSSTPSPQATVAPPAMASPVAEAAPVTPEGSWSDKLSAGLQDPAKAGLLGAGLSMMATPPRNVPYSGGEIIGNAGLHGLKFFQQAVDDKRKQQSLDVSQEEHKLNREQLGIYRQGMLEDKATQRDIARQNAVSLESMRTATSAARTGKLVPVKQADGSVAYERMLDAVGQEVPQKPERLVPVKQDDGSVTYEKTSEAAGQQVPGKPGYHYSTNDAGAVTVIKDTEVVATIKGAGKTARPAAGKSGKAGASEKLFQYQDRKAAESLKQKGTAAPTVEQIATERQRLFPKGTPKAAGRNPRAELSGTGAAETKVINGKTYKKTNGKWYEM